MNKKSMNNEIAIKLNIFKTNRKRNSKVVARLLCSEMQFPPRDEKILNKIEKPQGKIEFACKALKKSRFFYKLVIS